MKIRSLSLAYAIGYSRLVFGENPRIEAKLAGFDISKRCRFVDFCRGAIFEQLLAPALEMDFQPICDAAPKEDGLDSFKP